MATRRCWTSVIFITAYTDPDTVDGITERVQTRQLSQSHSIASALLAQRKWGRPSGRYAEKGAPTEADTGLIMNALLLPILSVMAFPRPSLVPRGTGEVPR